MWLTMPRRPLCRRGVALCAGIVGMKTDLHPARALACALALVVAAMPATAQPVAYRLDPGHSFVTFELLHFDTATLRGRFGPLDGEVQLDRCG